MVEAQHPAEPLGAFNGARCRLDSVARLNHPVVDPLMIPLAEIVSGVLASCPSKRPFTEEDHSIETLIFDRSDESLGVGIQVRRTVGQAYNVDAGIVQEIPERLGELGIAVEDKESFLSQRPFEGIDEVPADLHHPGFVRSRRDASDLDATRRQLDHEEDIEGDETTWSPDLDGEKVSSGEHAPVGLEELTPRRSFAALGSRVDSVLLEDVGDCRSANAVTDILQSALDSSVAPARILSSHSDGQVRDDLHDPSSPRTTPFVGPLLGNELPVPSEDRVGSDERCDFGQRTSANRSAADSEAATLIIGQSKPSATELLPEDAILLAEVFDDSMSESDGSPSQSIWYGLRVVEVDLISSDSDVCTDAADKRNKAPFSILVEYGARSGSDNMP